MSLKWIPTKAKSYKLTKNMTFSSIDKLLKYYLENKITVQGNHIQLKNCIDVEQLEEELGELEENLSGQYWFYGKLNRQHAEKILRSANFDAGVYLLRKSETGHYVFSIIADDRKWLVFPIKTRQYLFR